MFKESRTFAALGIFKNDVFTLVMKIVRCSLDDNLSAGVRVTFSVSC